MAMEIRVAAKAFRLICRVSLLLAATAVAAQEGHPAKGTWVGYWGPTLTAHSRIVLVIDHDGKTMSGVYQPGPNAVPLKVARLDITPGKPAVGVARGNSGQAPQIPAILPIFTVHFEIDTKDTRGNPVAIVAEGTMHNVALPNRSITGTWTQTSGGNAVKSEFKIARQ
jgi:hypothetical protein